MTKVVLTPTRFENGVYEGHLAGSSPPHIEVQYLGEPLPGIEIAAEGDGWRLCVPVPMSAVSDGVHSFVIVDSASGERLGSFTLMAGAPAADNLLAEVDLLRAELDMLKRAFRRLHRSED